MGKNEFNLVTGDGTFLIGRYWKPKNQPKAVICLVHGIGEHSGRYNDWALRFTREGYLVYAVDLRGHGLSEGKRGYVRHLSGFFGDIDSLVRRVKHNWNLPVFLYGHRMGGNLVLNFLLKKRQDFVGCIVTSPWLKLVHPPRAPLCNVAQLMDRVIPKATFKTGITSVQLTSDAILQTKSDEDKLMHGKISLRLFNQLTNASEEIMRKISRISIPVFLAHGTADDITEFSATKNLADKLDDLACFFPVENARHEIHHERMADELFWQITSWLTSSLKTMQYVG